MGVTIHDETLSGVRQAWSSLAEANEHKDDHIHVSDCTFDGPDEYDEAIRLDRVLSGRIEDVNILDGYAFGVRVHFGLYTKVDRASVKNCGVGFWIGDGTPVWTDATPSNSASNQSYFWGARFHGGAVSQKGFVQAGATNVEYKNCTVEGSACGTAFDIWPRAPHSNDVIAQGWIETTSGVGCAIKYDGHKGFLRVDGLRLAVKPILLLDTRGDQDSTVLFENCRWPDVPKSIISRRTEILFGEGNSFSPTEFFREVTFAG